MGGVVLEWVAGCEERKRGEGRDSKRPSDRTPETENCIYSIQNFGVHSKKYRYKGRKTAGGSLVSSCL